MASGKRARATKKQAVDVSVATGAAAPNGNDGLLITATGGDQTVGTSAFSGNADNGIAIGGNPSGVTVDPVVSGLTIDCAAPLPNFGDGLLIDGTAHDNTIGGYQLSIIPRKLFSANDRFGVVAGHAGGTEDIIGFNIYCFPALSTNALQREARWLRVVQLIGKLVPV